MADYDAPRTIYRGESRQMTPGIVSIAESLFDNGEFRSSPNRSRPEIKKRPYFELEAYKELV